MAFGGKCQPFEIVAQWRPGAVIAGDGENIGAVGLKRGGERDHVARALVERSGGAGDIAKTCFERGAAPFKARQQGCFLTLGQRAFILGVTDPVHPG